MSFMTDFSFDTIKDFDEHIDLSIPNYGVLAEAIINMSHYFVVDGTNIVDIGCSTGKLLEAIPHTGAKIGVDNSTNLLPESHHETTFVNADLKDFNGYGNSSLVLSVFTLQFVERRERLKILKRIYDSLVAGGVLILAEKVIADSGFEQEIFNFTHYDHKLKSFKAEEILKKEKTLRKIMRCNTHDENAQMADEAGFDKGFTFWKCLNFEAVLFRKSPPTSKAGK